MKPLSISAHRRGAALLIVLAILLLMTVLIVGFFAASEIETRSSSDNEHLSSLQRLQQLPLDIVKSQIYGATTLGQTGSYADVSNTWASQPGLIRVFNNQGTLYRAYKLYSSSQMEETNLTFLSKEVPTDWPAQTNLYVNLNQPFPSLTNSTNLQYPILNPAATNWAEGLSISTDPAGQTNAPMPVEWLYVLKDGSLVPNAGITNPTNPPTARIAFWTDDETCKVNINTAGERTFWDRPKSGSDRATALMYYQPSAGEYNAYPGHPATVSLSAVFSNALGGVNSNTLVQSMLSLTPRYSWGGSQNASLPTYVTRVSLDPTKAGSTVKDDRLYVSPSEIYFKPNRSSSDILSTYPNLAQAIKNSDFLITASSHAPELNLFGMPRIGLWPVDTQTSKQTIYDRLIARATTIGSQQFNFQRDNPTAMDEATSIERNWNLLQYLDRLTSQQIPGFGGAFTSKYPNPENRQILTEMFDYIRTLTNLCDTSRTQSQFSLQFTPALSSTRGYVLPTRITTWNTRGFGRCPVVTNVGVVLYAYNQRASDLYTAGYGFPPAIPSDTQTDVHMLLWFNFVTPGQGVAPYAANYTIILKSQPNFGLSNSDGTGAGTFTLRNLTESRFAFTDQGKDWGGYDAMVGEKTGEVTPGPPLSGYAFHSTTPITISGTTMNFTGGNLSFEIHDTATGQLLQTYTLNFPNSTALWPVPLAWQRTDLNTASNTLAPTLFENRNPQTTLDSDQTTAGYLLSTRRTDSKGYAADVIRGVELTHGDARIVACMDIVPSSMFQPSAGYLNGNQRIACSLLFERNTSDIVRVFGATFGSHVANVEYHDQTQATNYLPLLDRPPLPAMVGSTNLTSLRGMNWCGDIDSGYLGEPDGPFLNKPDEGFISTTNPATATAGTEEPYYRSMAKTLTSSGSTVQLRSWDPTEDGFFSPTRQVPSAVQFGSLPADVPNNEPWRTLLFCPNSQAAMVPSANGSMGHPGSQTPPDYLYLDLFTMPTVEPYAISEPFSTAGKINLNERVIPFTYIKRETGLWAVLQNMAINSVPSTNATISEWYKEYNTSSQRWHVMPSLDVTNTISQIATILDPAGNVGAGAFRSAAEICSVFFMPSDLSGQNITNYWQAHQLTADNSREAPYNYIYPLLTTQSNTYTVHYLVQTLTPLLAKANFAPANDFKVTGEMQGSYLLERYLDINNPAFQGTPPSIDPTTSPLSSYYKFRVLHQSMFTPGL